MPTRGRRVPHRSESAPSPRRRTRTISADTALEDRPAGLVIRRDDHEGVRRRVGRVSVDSDIIEGESLADHVVVIAGGRCMADLAPLDHQEEAVLVGVEHGELDPVISEGSGCPEPARLSSYASIFVSESPRTPTTGVGECPRARICRPRPRIPPTAPRLPGPGRRSACPPSPRGSAAESPMKERSPQPRS
jgi:hypothetical protein